MMRTFYRISLCSLLGASLVACGDEFLTTEPQTIITDDQIWGDADLIRNVLADLYDRIPLYQGLEQANNFAGNGEGAWTEFTAYDEAVYSGVTAGAQFRNSLVNYAFSRWVGTGNNTVWHQAYGLIRDINLSLENIEVAFPAGDQKTGFLAELRFLRALTYFHLVKRVGGVPLITSQQLYDFAGDPSYLQHPRATEAGVYDFIAAELDAIVDALGDHGSQTRASRYAALALKSRAMLYAGSIARHNSEMSSPITLPGGEVGIPAERAAEYYEKSLEASREIINSGAFALVQGGEPGEAFHQVFVSKGNTEVILAKDYAASQGKLHRFTMQAYPRSLRVEQLVNWGGAAISPSLNLVENFDYLDGSPGQVRGAGDGTAAGQSNWIFYDHPSDIFADKDGRLHGTAIVAGGQFAGRDVQLQAGVYVWDAAANRYDRQTGAIGSSHSDGGLLTGMDGPVPAEVYTSATGFYHRKFLDPSSNAPRIVGSETWWVLFRLGEIYMNAAEAAFELGLTGEAVDHLNTLRQRAGFPANSLASVDRSKIRSERWSELAFEDHRIWDLRRWRVAHQVWDGTSVSATANVYALFPYRVVHPGHPNHGKFVFDKFPASIQTAPRFFRMGNYYSQIPETVIAANPLLVRNPFH